MYMLRQTCVWSYIALGVAALDSGGVIHTSRQLIAGEPHFQHTEDRCVIKHHRVVGLRPGGE